MSHPPALLLCSFLLGTTAMAEDPDTDTSVEVAQVESMMGRGPAPEAPGDLSRTFTIAPLVIREDGNLIGVTGERLRVAALERARELGWPALGADNVLFGEDRSAEADLVLGGEVQRVYEAEVLGVTGWVVEVRWEVLDRRIRDVVYSVQTRFIHEGDWDDDDEDIDVEVTRGALQRVLRREAFADLLRDAGPGDAHQDGVLTLARCPDEPAALPEGIDQVVARTVLIQTARGHGAGVLVSPDGFVLTVAHVVDQGDVRVTLPGGVELDADVIRVDRAQDAGLIRIPGTGHKCVQNAEAPKLGSSVYLAGYPLAGDLSVSSGVVSGVRAYDDHMFVQTDAATNPGNSGGPLLDETGRLLGVMSWKIGLFDVEGMAFAVPPDAAADALAITWGAESDDVEALEIATSEKVVDEPDPPIADIPTGRLCMYRAADPPLSTTLPPLKLQVGRVALSMPARSWLCVEMPRGDYTIAHDGRRVGDVSVEDDEDTIVQVMPGDPDSIVINERIETRTQKALSRVQSKFSRLDP